MSGGQLPRMTKAQRAAAMRAAVTKVQSQAAFFAQNPHLLVRHVARVHRETSPANRAIDESAASAVRKRREKRASGRVVGTSVGGSTEA